MKAYLADDLCQSAVERQLEVAGDALGQVRKLDPDLFDRDHRRVYDAATTKVTELTSAIRDLLAKFPAS